MDTKTKTIGIATIAIFAIIPLGIFAADIFTVSPEEAAFRAAKARQEAMQSSCERITERIVTCWAGDKETCKPLQESKIWFKNEFGEYPELACPNSHDPLVFGAGQN